VVLQESHSIKRGRILQAAHSTSTEFEKKGEASYELKRLQGAGVNIHY